MIIRAGVDTNTMWYNWLNWIMTCEDDFLDNMGLPSDSIMLSLDFIFDPS